MARWIVYLALDSNAATKPSVKQARRRIADALVERGAEPRIVNIPPEKNVNGADDYIGVHGDAAWWALIDGARPATREPWRAWPVAILARLGFLDLRTESAAAALP